MFAISRFTSVLVLLCLGTGIAYSQLKYNTTFSVILSGEPGGLAVADFNRDGKPDVAVIHASTLSLFFNQGAGAFGTAHDTALAANSTSMGALAADVNRDGKIDLVIAQSTPQQMVVLLGNGDGTFQPALTFPLVNAPRGVSLGDLNNDGIIDLAVRECPASSSDCDIAVYLGHGTGMFTLDTVLPTPGADAFRAPSLTVTDFNRDGNLDIATAAHGGSSTAPTMHFTVFFGNGNGTFRTPVNVPVPFTLPGPDFVAGSPSIVAGDFNGDAVDDIAVETGSICGGSACGTATMNIFLNNRSGGFTLKSQFASSSDDGPESWRAADLNNDLRTDLTRFNPLLKGGQVQTWEGSGGGSFTTVSNPYATASPGFAEVRDINLEGRHDIILASSGLGETDLIVGLSGNGTPNCATPTSNALQAKLCTPGSNTGTRTFLVKASGNSPVGIKRVELWVDGVKRAQVLDDQLRRTLTLTPGTHRITIIAVDQYVGTAKTTRSVTVP